ncbi:small G protein family protein / RhoGAP family protein isoform X2 [Carex rostrata]
MDKNDMALDASPAWRQKATDFFSSSGVKIKQAGQSAGGNVADVAGKVNSMVKNRWALFQEKRQSKQEWTPPKETVQERLISAAASTTVLLRKGLNETKEKVVVGKVKVEEAAKKTLNNIERWQKGVASNDVFGVPIEVVVQREQSNTAVPQVLITCVDYLIVSGLSSEYLFKSEEDKKSVKQLISLFNEDWKATIPDGTNPIDVASLIKCYLASLPEPLITFVLFNEIREARSRIRELRNILKKLPSVNYMTLEFVTAFLLRVSQKSSLNKMDSRSLAIEMGPLIMWQKGDSGEELRLYFRYGLKGPSRSAEVASEANGFDYLEEDVQIPLDDAAPPDYGVIEVIQCLIEHHNAVFTDANETIWR